MSPRTARLGPHFHISWRWVRHTAGASIEFIPRSWIRARGFTISMTMPYCDCMRDSKIPSIATESCRREGMEFGRSICGVLNEIGTDADWSDKSYCRCMFCGCTAGHLLDAGLAQTRCVPRGCGEVGIRKRLRHLSWFRAGPSRHHLTAIQVCGENSRAPRRAQRSDTDGG